MARTVGAEMLAWREAHGLTQAAAAAAVSLACGITVSQAEWSRWESGAREPIDLARFGIPEVLRMTEEYLRREGE